MLRNVEHAYITWLSSTRALIRFSVLLLVKTTVHTFTYCTARSYNILGNLTAERRYRKDRTRVSCLYSACTHFVCFDAYREFSCIRALQELHSLVKTTSAEWVQTAVLESSTLHRWVCVCEIFSLFAHELCYRYYMYMYVLWSISDL